MKKKKGKSQRGKVAGALHLVSNIVVWTIASANIVVILLLLACGLCTFISPSTAPRLGLFCLFYPIFVIANLLFIPLWLLTRWKFAIIPVIGAILSIFFTQSYCPIHLLGGDDITDSSRVIRVMTFNSYNFHDLDKEGAAENHTFVQLLRNNDFDIIALQESDLSTKKLANIEPLLDSRGYNLMRCDDSHCRGQILLTRFQPIDAVKMSMPTSKSNSTVVFRMKRDNDTIIVINAHLESFHLEEPVKEHYRETLHQLDPDSTKSTGRFMVNLMQPKMKMHGEQIDSLLQYIDPLLKQDKILILCGDFNDSPVSYACRRARTALTDAYLEAGWGTGFTYHEKAMPFRIDHIFTSRRLKPVKTWVENSVLESDHYPLTTILELLPKKEDGAQ